MIFTYKLMLSIYTQHYGRNQNELVDVCVSHDGRKSQEESLEMLQDVSLSTLYYKTMHTGFFYTTLWESEVHLNLKDVNIQATMAEEPTRETSTKESLEMLD